MAIIKIKNPAIDLDAAEIPNLPASKITSGTLDNARISLDAAEIPNLDTAKITTGTLADARIPANALNSNIYLTNLSATNMTSGTIPNARYGTPTFNGSNLTNLPSGLTEVDCFGLNNINVQSFTSYTLTSANTTRLSSISGTTFTKTGTGVSIDSNGLVSFPSTGTYYVRLSGILNFLDGQNASYFGAAIFGTNNGATGGLNDRAFSAGIANGDGSSTQNHAQAIVTLLWTVGNTSNDKLSFQFQTNRNSSNVRLWGNEAPRLLTQFTIIKVAG